MIYPLVVDRSTLRRMAQCSLMAFPQERGQRFRVGSELPIALDSTDHALHIRVDSKLIVEAATIDFGAARRMGWRTSDEWRADWLRRYHPALVTDDDLSDQRLAAVMRTELPDELVALITFTRVEGSRVLVSGAGTGRGYAPAGDRLALPGEPEPVDDETLARFAAAARARRETERGAEMQARAIKGVLADITRRAVAETHRGRDLSAELAGLRKLRDRLNDESREAAA